MSKSQLLVLMISLIYVGFAVPMIWISYMLANGRRIIPDLELGYTVNINMIELVLAIVLLVVQFVLLGTLYKTIGEGRKHQR